MITAKALAWDDTILPFQLDRSDVRGRVARLDRSLEQILAQHAYPPVVEALVAEAVLLTALIGQTVKQQWKLSLQIRGRGAIRLIATDWFAPERAGESARIRAYAGYRAEDLTPGKGGFEQLGEGYFAMMIDQGPGTTPYSGITPKVGTSLADCAQTYFAQSEQLPTRFALSFGRSSRPGQGEHWRAGGVMIQHMPKASPFVASEGGSGEHGVLTAHDLMQGSDEEAWQRVNARLEEIELFELVGPEVDSPELVARLFAQEEPRVFAAQPVRFGCTCSARRARNALSIYSARDIGTMTTEEGIVTADCQFCGAHYEFDPATLGFEATMPPPEDEL